jgi:hypothetical protein
MEILRVIAILCSMHGSAEQINTCQVELMGCMLNNPKQFNLEAKRNEQSLMRCYVIMSGSRIQPRK